MSQMTFYKFQTSSSKFKKCLRGLFECILPCVLTLVLFQYIAYNIPTIIIQSAHVKGMDLSTEVDKQLAGWINGAKFQGASLFVIVYSPSVILWLIMPFVIYGLYGRKHFYRYFCLTSIYSLVCFVLYILFPTSAVLQMDTVNSNNETHFLTDGNFFDKMLFKQYIAAAPYGEAPSGHGGNSIIFLIALIKPREQKKYTKAGLTLLICGSIFATLVCLATMFLRQHNILDGAVTITIITLIYLIIANTKIASKVERFFMTIHIKLGIMPACEGISQYQYNAKSTKPYYAKLVFTGILYGLVLIGLLCATGSCSLGAMFGVRCPQWLVPTYGASYVQDPDGKGVLANNASTGYKTFLGS